MVKPITPTAAVVLLSSLNGIVTSLDIASFERKIRGFGIVLDIPEDVSFLETHIQP